MDLTTILEKTRKKSERIIVLRKPPSIATNDRPYLQKNTKKENIGGEEANWRQTGDKLETNRGQTEDKLETNRGQTRDKLETNYKQTRDRTRDRTGDKLETNWRHENPNITSTEPHLFFSSLVGLQRSLVFAIFNECKINRTKITNPISIEYLAKVCNSSVSSIKKSIQRLEKKSVIFRATFKNGRSGWTKYELNENIYKEIIIGSISKIDDNWRQTGDKLGTELGTKVKTTALSSSISDKITTTTLGDKNNVIANHVWDLNITPLIHIGFTQKHLEQISKRTQCSQEDVQEAIYAFAHDLENKRLKMRNGNEPLNFFMGIMSKGNLYLPISTDYVNPMLKASQIYLEKREERKLHCKKLDDELRAESFEKWSHELSEEEKENILPEDAKKSPFKHYAHSSLLTYHKRTVWPEVRLSFYTDKNLPFFELKVESEAE